MGYRQSQGAHHISSTLKLAVAEAPAKIGCDHTYSPQRIVYIIPLSNSGRQMVTTSRHRWQVQNNKDDAQGNGAVMSAVTNMAAAAKLAEEQIRLDIGDDMSSGEDEVTRQRGGNLDVLHITPIPSASVGPCHFSYHLRTALMSDGYLTEGHP